MHRRSRWLLMGIVAVLSLASWARMQFPFRGWTTRSFASISRPWPRTTSEGRKPGTAGEEKTVEYIRSKFAEAGLARSRHNFLPVGAPRRDHGGSGYHPDVRARRHQTRAQVCSRTWWSGPRRVVSPILTRQQPVGVRRLPGSSRRSTTGTTTLRQVSKRQDCRHSGQRPGLLRRAIRSRFAAAK